MSASDSAAIAKPIIALGTSSLISSNNFRVMVVRCRVDDGAGVALFFFFFWGREVGGIFHEDARADEDSFGAELHHQRRVGGGGDASGGEIRHGQLPCFGDD